jgi:phosphate transport system permease protein
LPAIAGTMVSSLIALVLAGVFGVAIAVFLTERYLPDKLTTVLKNIVDLLAAIPSVVYGLWGLAIIIPLMGPVAEWLYSNMSWFPPFSTPLGIGGMAPAALVLAIMILPTVAAISRDALAAVHPRTKEAAYGLGATRWEVIFRVVLPTASGGIFGGLILGFGRALGETMALAMLMGNRNELSWSVFAPGNTLSALIANSYKEASGDLVPRLIYAALVLLIITMVINFLGGLVLQHAAKRFQGSR